MSHTVVYEVLVFRSVCLLLLARISHPRFKTCKRTHVHIKRTASQRGQSAPGVGDTLGLWRRLGCLPAAALSYGQTVLVHLPAEHNSVLKKKKITATCPLESKTASLLKKHTCNFCYSVSRSKKGCFNA